MSDLREAFGALSQPPQPAPKLANCPICGGFVMMLCNCTLREHVKMDTLGDTKMVRL